MELAFRPPVALGAGGVGGYLLSAFYHYALGGPASLPPAAVVSTGYDCCPCGLPLLSCAEPSADWAAVLAFLRAAAADHWEVLVALSGLCCWIFTAGRRWIRISVTFGVSPGPEPLRAPRGSRRLAGYLS